MIIAIHQPNYLPWLGYFDKIGTVDMFVFLDTVQFVRNDFQHRNRIKTPAGPKWLSVPCIHNGSRGVLLDQRIAYDTDWAEEHWRLLQISYASAPFGSALFQCLATLYGKRFETLVELNISLIKVLADALGLKCQWQRSSHLDLPTLHKSELLAAICQRLGADEYLSGVGAKSYLDYKAFDSAGVQVKWQSFSHPTYEQRWMKQGFVPNLSVVDLLANTGPRSAHILHSARVPKTEGRETARNLCEFDVGCPDNNARTAMPGVASKSAL